jgi:hypothetical protein
VSTSMSKSPAEPRLPNGFRPRMLSFDVYGTLVNTPPASLDHHPWACQDVGRVVSPLPARGAARRARVAPWCGRCCI